MSEETIYDRLLELHQILQYDTCSLQKYFSPGERICINQERASLFEQLNFLNGLQKEFRQSRVSNNIEGKIEFITTKIRNLKQK